MAASGVASARRKVSEKVYLEDALPLADYNEHISYFLMWRAPDREDRLTLTKDIGLQRLQEVNLPVYEQRLRR